MKSQEKTQELINQQGKEQLKLFSDRILELCKKQLKDFNAKTIIDVKAKFYPNFCWEIEVGVRKIRGKKIK